MPDPTTPAKGLSQPQVGGDSDKWGDLLNADLSLIDSALGGTLALTISGDTTLTDVEAQNTGYKFIGTLTSAATITWPIFFGQLFIRNATAGDYAITCGMSGGASITVPNGNAVFCWSDGADFIQAT